MKTNKQSLLLKGPMRQLVLCLCAMSVAIWWLRPTVACGGQEPEYQGRLLSDWAGDVRSSNSQQQRDLATQAIGQIGTNALPFLLAEHLALNQKFQEMGLTTFASSREVIRRRANIDSIVAALSSTAMPLAPALASLVKEEKDPAFIAARSLAQIDPKTADALFAKQLTSKSWNTRACIAGTIRDLGTNCVLSMPALVQCLKHERGDTEQSATVKMRGLNTLMDTGSHSDQVVEALLDCLKDKNYAVRALAVLSLQRLGGYARPAIADLRQMSTNDPAPDLRVRAQKTLASIGAEQSISANKEAKGGNPEWHLDKP